VTKVVAGEGKLVVELVDGQSIDCSIARVRHGNDARLIVTERTSASENSPEPQLTKLMADAHRARALAYRKPSASIDQLAFEFGRSTSRFKRLIRLSYLAPSIVESISAGQQPASLTSVRLQHLDGLPLAWADQQSLLLG
jgi:site-specific DNA recombinase